MERGRASEDYRDIDEMLEKLGLTKEKGTTFHSIGNL